MEIDRQVCIDAAPIRVGVALAHSTWRSAMRIEPAGAGCRVLISAAATPDGVAQTIEALALAEVCAARSRLEADAGQSPPGPHLPEPRLEQPKHITRQQGDTP